MCVYEHTPLKVDGIRMSLLESILVGMYAKCGSVDDAWRFFQHLMPSWKMWSPWTLWSVGKGKRHWTLNPRKMQHQGMHPNLFTFCWGVAKEGEFQRKWANLQSDLNLIIVGERNICLILLDNHCTIATMCTHTQMWLPIICVTSFFLWRRFWRNGRRMPSN